LRERKKAKEEARNAPTNARMLPQNTPYVAPIVRVMNELGIGENIVAKIINPIIATGPHTPNPTTNDWISRASGSEMSGNKIGMRVILPIAARKIIGPAFSRKEAMYTLKKK
jgi:hypothetical protein